MRRTSLVHARAHLSELVDEAEHKGKPCSSCATASPMPRQRHPHRERQRAVSDEARAAETPVQRWTAHRSLTLAVRMPRWCGIGCA
jgi:hypothetical protein